MARFIPFIISIILTFASCENKKHEPRPTKGEEQLFINMPGSPRLLFDAETIIYALNNDAPLEGKHIGFAGGESDSYRYFEMLKQYASSAILVRLTHHTNPKMRVYGMWALIDRNRQLSLQQIPRLKLDNALVQYHEGCIVSSETVSSLVASHFTPTELNINYSTGKIVEDLY